MSVTLQRPETIDLTAIPSPKFAVGDRVNIADNDMPGVNIIQGYCYVPFCPNDPRHDRPQYPVQGSGIHYFIEQRMSATSFYETVHEDDLSLA